MNANPLSRRGSMLSLGFFRGPTRVPLSFNSLPAMITRIMAVTVALSALACTPNRDDYYAALPAVGTSVPAFRYATAEGAILDPAALRGRPAVVALWASECSASRLALESLGALHREYASRGAAIVILADDRERAAVDSLVAAARVTAPVALAGETLIATFTHGQSVLPWRKAFALPTFLVLDADGRVVYRQIGVERDAAHRLVRVRAVMDSLLAPTP